MTMRKSSITYDFYYADYLGGREGLIPRSEFDGWARCAEDRILPYITGEGHDDEVNRALCEAAEYLCTAAKHRGINSETIDGYRVDYAGGVHDTAEVLRIAAERLSPLGLLYMGVE